MLLVPLAALVAAQNPSSAPVSARPDLLTSWTSWGGEAVLQAHFAGSSHWIRGFGITPHDTVSILPEDMNHDGQTDVTVRIQAPGGQLLHHVLMTEALPPLLDLDAGPAFESLVSDEDNFGFGAAPVPCAFFDHSEPEDVNVFDEEADELGLEVDAWSHDVSAFLPSLTGSALVSLEIRELFSDAGADSKLVVESTLALSFERAGSDCASGCSCAFGTVHVYSGVLDELSSFLDGSVDVVFEENLDDIGLDWSRLTIQPL